MKQVFKISDFDTHLGKTLNRLLITHIPEIKFCYENHKDFAKWYDVKFTKYSDKIDHEDVRVMVESLNKCMPELLGNALLVEFTERQEKEAEEFAESIRESIIKPFCDSKGYDFISGMGTFFFSNKKGDIIDVEDLKHPTIGNLLSMNINEKFSLGDYVRDYTPLNGYTAKRIKKEPKLCEERNIKLSL